MYYRFRRYRHLRRSKDILRFNEELEILLLKEFLNRSSVFFDVGANIGIYSYYASKYLNEENIYIFEPLSNYFLSLKKIFIHSKLYNIALSDKEANEAKIKVPIINSKNLYSRATLNLNYIENNEENAFLENIKVSTLDNFCNKMEIKKIDLIKIDVEGHEYNVIKGGKESLIKYRPILLIEIEQRHHKEDISQIFDYLGKIGYFAFYLNPTDYCLKRLEINPAFLQDQGEFKKKSYINNFIFINGEDKISKEIEVINLRLQEALT